MVRAVVVKVVKVVGGTVAALLLITVAGGLAGLWDRPERQAVEAPPPERDAAAAAAPDAFALDGVPVAARELEAGKSYRASRKVPLMPVFEPRNRDQTMAAIGSIQDLPAGEPFTVLGAQAKSGTPWYRVTSDAGGGWVNSVALMGAKVVLAD
jgi:hypothetical protein